MSGAYQRSWKWLLTIGVVAVCHLPSLASAQSHPLSLTDKTCRGVFNIPGLSAETGVGALQYKFSPAGVSLIGHVWRAAGQDAYDRLATEVETRKLTDDMRGFVVATDLMNFVIDGKHVTFTSRTGAKYDMIFDDGQLNGTGDPRGVPGQQDWSVADIRMLCR